MKSPILLLINNCLNLKKYCFIFFLNKYFFTYILHFSTLLIGSLIYIFFRSETLVLFTWIGYFENIHEFVYYLRGYTVELAIYFPLWFIYSYPDGMWVYSYVFLLLMIFDFKINRNDSIFAFPRYTTKDICNANSASAALNKWMKEKLSKPYVIHGFRHSFRDRLRAIECPLDIIDQLGGWRLKSVGQGYGKGYELSVLSKWVIEI